jgi:hypothetical protein
MPVVLLLFVIFVAVVLFLDREVRNKEEVKDGDAPLNGPKR